MMCLLALLKEQYNNSTYNSNILYASFTKSNEDIVY